MKDQSDMQQPLLKICPILIQARKCTFANFNSFFYSLISIDFFLIKKINSKLRIFCYRERNQFKVDVNLQVHMQF